MIFIAGNARSGTSWLGKIFDSHPEVVYRHEPDGSRPCYDFPFFIESDHYEQHESIAAEYLQQLRDVRTIRSVGRPPAFAKAYRSQVADHAHVALIATMKSLARIPMVSASIERASIPDLVTRAAEQRLVMKSVVSLGRFGLYSRVLANEKLILIIRHPCGVVASQLRGLKAGKLSSQPPLKTLSKSTIGRGYGLSVAGLEAMTMAEQYAWTWLVMNEQAVNSTRGRENVVSVTHEALCAEPVREAKRLFDFCGLSWSKQTEEFLTAPQSHERKPSYFDVRRNSTAEIEKWRSELLPETIASIESILARSSLATLFDRS